MDIDNKEEFLEKLREDGLEKEDMVELKGDLPEKPEFPFLMFALGVTKDIIDYCDGMGVIGAVANIIIWPIFFVYFWSRVNRSEKMAMKKIMKSLRKRIIQRIVASGILEEIPVGNWIPTYSILVIWAYEKELGETNKIISYYKAFEKFAEKIV